MQIRHYRVTIKLPDSITNKQMESYIRTAIQMWRKGGDPESALFNMPQHAFGVRVIMQPEDPV